MAGNDLSEFRSKLFNNILRDTISYMKNKVSVVDFRSLNDLEILSKCTISSKSLRLDVLSIT